MKKFRLTLYVLALSLIFSTGVFAQPRPGTYDSGAPDLDFPAGSWSETLYGGAEGATGNEIAAAATGYYQFEGAKLYSVIQVGVPSGTSPYYVYRTVYTGGELKLYNNPSALPLAGWFNPGDGDVEYSISLADTIVVTKKYVDPATGDFTGEIEFELNVTDATLNDFPGWTASVTANYDKGTPTSVPVEEGDPLIYGGSLSNAVITIQSPLIGVPVDVKPGSCPNPVNVKSKGVIPVAILGTADFDVTLIDPASVTLNGIAPLRSSFEDVATPFVPLVENDGAEACHELGPDGYMDLGLKFDTQQFVASLIESLGTVNDRETIVVQLTGTLKDGTEIQGEDVILILKPGKNK